MIVTVSCTWTPGYEPDPRDSFAYTQPVTINWTGKLDYTLTGDIHDIACWLLEYTGGDNDDRLHPLTTAVLADRVPSGPGKRKSRCPACGRKDVTE